MITYLRNWFRNRQQDQQIAAYLAGYGWAWSAHMVEDYTLSYIRDKLFTEYDQSPCDRQFDAGAQEAIKDMETLLFNGKKAA